ASDSPSGCTTTNGLKWRRSRPKTPSWLRQSSSGNVASGGSTMQAPLLAGNTMGSLETSFAVAEWSDPGGPVAEGPRYIAPWHVHHSDDEAWYVLEGKLCVQSGPERVELSAG